MRSSLAIVTAVAAAFVCNYSSAQTTGSYDVFIPIAKYISHGDAESLSAWFADNLEITIFSNTSECSRNQAKQIVKTFFSAHTPRAFDIIHTAGRNNIKYALGSLKAGGELYEVTIFVNYKGRGYRIQQLKIKTEE